MDFSLTLNRFLPGLICLAAATASATAGFIDRDLVEPGIYAVLRNGRTIFLECSPPSGSQAQAFFEKYLEDPGVWRMYADKGAVAIAFTSLCPEAKRKVLLALFPLDYIDETGWWHTVRFQMQDSTESLDAIAEWLTGSSASAEKISRHASNRAIREPLKRGDKILVPQPLLLPVMKKHKAPPSPPVVPQPPVSQSREKKAVLEEDKQATPGIAFPFLNGNAEGFLEYTEDAQGRHAVYKLQKGESLYSAVVVRFTDFRDNSDILEACETIAKRSGIQNVHRISPGQKIVIPLEMLTDRFQPADSEQRQSYESIRVEERQLEKDRVKTKDLEGVVIILDPGHGGRDRGAAIEKLNLYEDEINYDIVCRIKALIEAGTQAQVHVTVYDPNQGYTPINSERFVHDTDEILNTTPVYNNQDAKISANLRWYLADDIYYRARSRGVDERKIFFGSIHCDALFNETLRGAMVYVPGLKYRSDPDISTAGIYGRFEEVKRNSTIKTTIEERRRDEILSRFFASTLLNAMRTNTPPLKVHDAGDPVRHVIRQSGGKAYLPAVLRHNVVPAKVLVEIANMTNPLDQQRLADSRWRQWFAEAFVAAVRAYYNQ